MGETKGETGSFLVGGAMLSKSLIQFSVDGLSCVPSLLFVVRPHYGGGNEDNLKIIWHHSKRSQEALLHSVPPTCIRPALTHPSARDSWILLGKSGSVSCGVTAPFSGSGEHKCLTLGICLCPPRVCLPSPV